MVRLPLFLGQRVRRLNRRRTKKGRRYILCWLQQTLRAHDNPIIDVAVYAGNELGLPIVIYHGLDNRYPYASHRLHRFILQASQSLERDLQARRVRFCRYVRRAAKREPSLVYRLAEDAAMLITDDMPTFVARWQSDSVAKKAMLPVWAVDAACAVPMNLLPERLEATKSFRAAHRPLRKSSVAVETDIAPTIRKFTGKLCFDHDDIVDVTPRRLDTFIGKCDVDMTVPPAVDFPGDRDSALAQLGWAIENVIPRYKWTRNNAALEESTTKLSPYFHFGVLGPRETVNWVQEAELHSAARWKFFDEMLTWREYYHHLARHAERPNSYLNVPAWARNSLADHAGDARPELYTLDQLIHAETDDETWNASQRQFTLDGWMHNNLRMYWVKQIIKWRPTPEDAWTTACYLNDRFSLDGRDPATYGSIQWGFGRSKRGYRELPVYGWVPTKSDSAIRKRAGMREWIEMMNEREMIRVDVPTDH